MKESRDKNYKRKQEGDMKRKKNMNRIKITIIKGARDSVLSEEHRVRGMVPGVFGHGKRRVGTFRLPCGWKAVCQWTKGWEF